MGTFILVKNPLGVANACDPHTQCKHVEAQEAVKLPPWPHNHSTNAVSTLCWTNCSQCGPSVGGNSNLVTGSVQFKLETYKLHSDSR